MSTSGPLTQEPSAKTETRADVSGGDRAGVEYWNRERVAEGSGGAPVRSFVKRLLDRKVDRMYRELLSPVHAGGSILEVGCAPGWILARLGRARPDLHLHGIDYAPQGVEEARAYLAKAGVAATVHLGDLRTYGRPEGFDAVVSAGLVEHYDDPVSVAGHHARIAGPGRFVMVTIPNFATPLAGAVFRWSDPASYETHNLAVMSPDSLAEVLRAAGMVDVESGWGGGSRLYVPSSRPGRLRLGIYRVAARAWNATFAMVPGFAQPFDAFVWGRGRVP